MTNQPLKNQIILGIDFDNTIINYDQLMYDLALEKSFIPKETPKNKKAVRNTIRILPDGDIKWQQIQAQAYGPAISKATLTPGIKELLAACHQQKITYYIISHKTKYSNLLQGGANLQESALSWLNQQQFFNNPHFTLTLNQVYFEPTKERKIERIKTLQCTHFIDDLEETFQESTFPQDTKKILFNPHFKNKESTNTQPTTNQTNLIIAPSFEIITQIITKDEQTNIKREELKFLSQQLLNEEIKDIQKLDGGKNNQVYLLTTSNNQKYILKSYYTHPNDKRNRLQTEYTSLEFLWNNNIKSIPKPIAKDEKNNIAIYQFIAGTKITPKDITEQDINAAINFLTNINNLNIPKDTFQDASDACFCIQDYLNIINRRLKHLKETPNSTDIENTMHSFLENQYIPYLNETIAKLQNQLNQLNQINTTKDQKIITTILSPCDFGFHNALRIENNNIIFLDFEYFGYDDPAKTISDFILHPAMNLSQTQKNQFAKKIIETFNNQELKQRISIVFPLVGLIWCLIILNEFVSHHQSRRNFANQPQNEEIKIAQLQKAQDMLNYIKENHFQKLLN